MPVDHHPTHVADGADFLTDTGATYDRTTAVQVRVRRRGHVCHLDDDGTAVRLSGRPTGWFGLVDSLMAVEGFNVNRRGVIFVPVAADRDIPALMARLGAASRTAYLALIELDDPRG